MSVSSMTGRLKTVQEWLASALEAVKDNSSFPAALRELSPWAEAGFEAAKEVAPPLKFVVKLLSELTKVPEPEALAAIACTVAYQSAAEKAFTDIGAPQGAAAVKNLRETAPADEADFAAFTLGNLAALPYVRSADRVVEYAAEAAGYSRAQIQSVVSRIHDLYPDEVVNLISHGDTKEKFEPLFRWAQLDAAGRAARAALRRHAEYVEWQYREAPILEQEPYALQHVYIETDCAVLTRVELLEKNPVGNPVRDPFKEGERNGGRHPLLETVLDRIACPEFRDAIVIQGSAGTGKSSFTLRLAAELRARGLRPVRIRLRDVNVTREFWSALGDAIAYEDDNFLRAHARFAAPPDVLRASGAFQDEITFGEQSARICPYVLILDGWDEISVAVSDAFKQRVKDLLRNIRYELLRPHGPRVRVILTGRPSDAIDDCADFFLDSTPVLTMRLLRPEQLRELAGLLRAALESRPVAPARVSSWTMPPDEELEPLFIAFEEAVSKGNSSITTVAGMPFLAQLTFRLCAEDESGRDELLRDQSTLLRRLIDLAVKYANRPSDREQGRELPGRISGERLRQLLRRTATEMTILGQESISRTELAIRLKIDDAHLRGITKDNVITGMLVSFYFKGGNAALGCEFTHKAFREYLFAEAVVERLKEYGRSVERDGPEREPGWQDFDAADPRRGLAYDLAEMLGPRWLTLEVITHLTNLLIWEITRVDQGRPGDGETAPLTMDCWRLLRNALADLWDWWAEGVPVRPQPYRDEDGQLKWHDAPVVRVVRRCGQLALGESVRLPPPVPFTWIDAHLGEALFRLCCWLHHFVDHSDAPRPGPPRRRCYQSVGERVRFRPAAGYRDTWITYVDRINAAGGREFGAFPSWVEMNFTDFAGVDASRHQFEFGSMEGADLTGARLEGCSFRGTYLHGARFVKVQASETNFIGADMENADLSGGSFAYAYFGSFHLNTTKREGAGFEGAREFMPESAEADDVRESA